MKGLKHIGQQAGVTHCTWQNMHSQYSGASTKNWHTHTHTHTMMQPSRQLADLILARLAGKHISAAAKGASLPGLNAPWRPPLCACTGSTSWLCFCGAWPQTAQPGSQHGGHPPAATHSPQLLHKCVDICVYLGESSAGRPPSSSIASCRVHLSTLCCVCIDSLVPGAVSALSEEHGAVVSFCCRQQSEHGFLATKSGACPSRKLKTNT